MMLPANPTGADLVAAIEAHAAAKGVRPFEIARLISSNPRKWLQATPAYKTPKPQTIARISALLAGEPIPASPPTLNKATGRRSPDHLVRAFPVEIEAQPRVYREPCFKCGVRADIGCRHQPLLSADGEEGQ